MSITGVERWQNILNIQCLALHKPQGRTKTAVVYRFERRVVRENYKPQR